MKKTLILFFAPVVVLLLFGFFKLEKSSNGLSVGDEAIDFKLRGVDGNKYSLKDLKSKGAIVIFTCNHCPYAVAYEDRIESLHKKFKNDYPVIAINPNDTVAYPDDSFSKMVTRVKEKGFTFPYLIDETQQIAKQYGALKTPHVYLLKNEKSKWLVKYIGAIDDNYAEPEQVKIKYLEDAISSLEKGKDPNPSSTKAIGCSIKWKK
ncbi:MAG: thioredoxin family protein [Cytophagales bacterium]